MPKTKETRFTTERRFFPASKGIELRMDEGDEAAEGVAGVISHHSPPWETLSQMLWREWRRDGETWKPVYETFKRGAFRDVLKDDVVCLRDHASSRLLGRTVAGTLSLEEDAIGLRYECHVPDTQEGVDTVKSIRRGDLNGSSFAFTVAENGDEWEETDDKIIRTVTRVAELFDVGPVTYPAYLTPEDVGLRSFGACNQAVAAFERWSGKRSSVAPDRLAEMQRRQKLAAIR